MSYNLKLSLNFGELPVFVVVWNLRSLLDCVELNSLGAITVNSIAGLSDTV